MPSPIGSVEQNRTFMEKRALLKCKVGLEDNLEQKGRPKCTMWVDHPTSSNEAQFQSLLGSFFSGTLETHGDFS